MKFYDYMWSRLKLLLLGLFNRYAHIDATSGLLECICVESEQLMKEAKRDNEE